MDHHLTALLVGFLALLFLHRQLSHLLHHVLVLRRRRLPISIQSLPQLCIWSSFFLPLFLSELFFVPRSSFLTLPDTAAVFLNNVFQKGRGRGLNGPFSLRRLAHIDEQFGLFEEILLQLVRPELILLLGLNLIPYLQVVLIVSLLDKLFLLPGFS